MIFVIITATIGGLQIFTEPKLFNPSSAVPGGPQRQYQTTVLYLWDMAFNRQNFGKASAIAWLLFLIIVALRRAQLPDLAPDRLRPRPRVHRRRTARDDSHGIAAALSRLDARGEERMTATARPASARRRDRSRAPKRRALGIDRRPGFLTYGLLLAVFVGGAYPLWWSFVAGSSDQHGAHRRPGRRCCRAASSGRTSARCSTPSRSGRRSATRSSSPP